MEFQFQNAMADLQRMDAGSCLLANGLAMGLLGMAFCTYGSQISIEKTLAPFGIKPMFDSPLLGVRMIGVYMVFTGLMSCNVGMTRGFIGDQVSDKKQNCFIRCYLSS